MRRPLARRAAAAALLLAAASCSRAPSRAADRAAPAAVLASESFLADIVGAVAGDRIAVRTLVPIGADPHSWEPAPRDAAAVAGAALFIVNGDGLESFLAPLLSSIDGPRVVEASDGLAPRAPREGEPGAGDADHETDPHYWLNPLNVVRYAQNIRDALSALDPAGADAYRANAAAYAEELRALDRWIAAEVARVPPERRLLVTNHESLGYFADRYGFRIVGTVIPSVSTGSSPSARQLAALVDRLRETGAPALFVEEGADARVARQIADEAGVALVTGLRTHTLTDASGPAPSYLAMMRADVRTIVDALGAP
ncbi:MAG TPA: metal ABC transporter substrate-binding protein [Desulfobacterales bacterium]|nr:metal ABC transporter substrate-binding protein [Desulfobacterales bacterium]